MRRRNIHSSVKVLEYFGSLPDHYRARIDKSQLSRYRKTIPQHFFGNELNSISENEIVKFRQINKNAVDRKIVFAYLRMAITVRNIFSAAKHFYKTMNESKEKIAEVIQTVSRIFSVKTCAKIIGIAESSLRIWITQVRIKCSNSLINICRKVHPNQLLSIETDKMKKLLLDNELKFWPLRSLYYFALNKELVSMCLSTWYKYSKLFTIVRLKPRSVKVYGSSIIASKPNQYWHADVTYFKTEDGLLHYIYTVVDNFSKFPLSVIQSTCLSGKIRTESFRVAIKTAIKLNPVTETINLIVDGGSENFNGTVDEFLANLKTFKVNRIRALKDVAYSNSMAEAFNRTLKTYYLNHQKTENTGALKRNLNFAVADFSCKRPHGELKGLTPFEAYTGKTPPSFTQQLFEARKNRIEMNKKYNCQGCR